MLYQAIVLIELHAALGVASDPLGIKIAKVLTIIGVYSNCCRNKPAVLPSYGRIGKKREKRSIGLGFIGGREDLCVSWSHEGCYGLHGFVRVVGIVRKHYEALFARVIAYREASGQEKKFAARRKGDAVFGLRLVQLAAACPHHLQVRPIENVTILICINQRRPILHVPSLIFHESLEDALQNASSASRAIRPGIQRRRRSSGGDVS
jgi:hypothetical protein